MIKIESLLSARLFLVPQIVGDHLYFISNLNGRNSLYRLKSGGSVPEPLLPPDIALQNPHLIQGQSFTVCPAINQILVMIDQDGDENYQPMVIPLTGGYPQSLHPETFAGHSLILGEVNHERHLAYLIAQSRSESLFKSFSL